MPREDSDIFFKPQLQKIVLSIYLAVLLYTCTVQSSMSLKAEYLLTNPPFFFFIKFTCEEDTKECWLQT